MEEEAEVDSVEEEVEEVDSVEMVVVEAVATTPH